MATRMATLVAAALPSEGIKLRTVEQRRPNKLEQQYIRRLRRYRNVTGRPYVAPPVPDLRERPFGFAEGFVALPGRRANLSVSDVALAYELLLSPVSGQHHAPWGEGSRWFGVDTRLDPVDAATFSALLWEAQPDLILEIGTECGGSALFFATIMRMYNRRARCVAQSPACARPGARRASATRRTVRRAGVPRARARVASKPWASSCRSVLTWDVTPRWKRCARLVGHGGDRARHRTRKAYQSERWARYQREGTIVERIADVSSPAERALARAYAENASVVWVIDDGDHFAPVILVHFDFLAALVKPAGRGYYIVADTRLERACLSQFSLRGGLPVRQLYAPSLPRATRSRCTSAPPATLPAPSLCAALADATCADAVGLLQARAAARRARARRASAGARVNLLPTEL